MGKQVEEPYVVDIIKTDTIKVGPHKIMIDRVDGSREADITVEFDKEPDQDELELAIKDKLIQKYWYLGEEYKEGPKRQFDILIDSEQHISTSLEVFEEEGFNEEVLLDIRKGLGDMYAALKDKSLWSLKSIQVMREGFTKGDEGKAVGGAEYPRQKRFELYLKDIASKRYEDMGISGVSGVVMHELTHINLENALAALWKKNLESLGWLNLTSLGFADNARILSKAGMTTGKVALDEDKFPNRYAMSQQDDDRAESVVLWIVGRDKLNSLRAHLLSFVLDDTHRTVSSELPVATEVDAEREILEQITYKVIIQEDDGWEEMEVSTGRGLGYEFYTRDEVLEKVFHDLNSL